MRLIKYVRAIEDKYGLRWYEDANLDLSKDDDWIAILAIRKKLGFIPFEEKGSCAGNPKKWDQDTIDYVKSNLISLFKQGIFSKKAINRFFDIGIDNRQWFPRVIKYLDLEEYYINCKKIVVVDSGVAKEFDDYASAAKYYNVKSDTVKRAITNRTMMKYKYRVYRYVDYVA